MANVLEENKKQLKKKSAEVAKIGFVLNEYKKLIVAVIGLFIAGAFYSLYVTTPVYETSAKIAIIQQEKSRGGAGAMAEAFGFTNNSVDLHTEKAVFSSVATIKRALEKIEHSVKYFSASRGKTIELYKETPFKVNIKDIPNKEIYGLMFKIKVLSSDEFILSIEYGFKQKLKDNIKVLLGKPSKLIKYRKKHYFNEVIENENFTIQVKKINFLEFDEYKFELITIESMIKTIKESIFLKEVKKDASVIRITLEDTVPLRSKEILDSIIDTYLEDSLEKKLLATKRALDYIDTELAKTKNSLDRSEKKLEEFKSLHGLMDVQTESKLIIEKLSKLESSLGEVDIQERTFSILYKEFENGNYAALGSFSLQQPIITSLIGDLQKAISQRDKLLIDYTQEYPEVIKLSAQISDLKRAIEDAIEGISANLKERKNSLIEQIITNESKLNRLPIAERRYVNLLRKTKFK